MKIATNKNSYSGTTNFFLYCSGADKDFLDNCPRKEVTKYSIIGSLVLMTGIFAFISSSYAFHSFFNPVPLEGKWKLSISVIFLSVLLGIVWGTFIFFIDRAFVATMSKNMTWGRQFLLAIPRYALAFLLSISVSKPLEIFLFKKRIALELTTKERETRTNNLSREMNKSEAAESLLDSTNRTLTDLNLKKTALSDEEKTLQSALKGCQANCDTVTRQNNELAANASVEITVLTSRSRPLQINLDELVDRESSEYRFLRKQLEDIQIQKRNEVAKIATYGMNKTIACECVKYYTEELKGAEKRRIANIDSQIVFHVKFKNEIEILQKSANDTLEAASKIISRKTASAFSENFIAQLDALSELLEDKKLWKIHLVIWLIFLVIEIAPVSIKLFLNRGEYDEIEKAHMESMKEQTVRYKEKQRKVFETYYARAEDENISLIHTYFDKIRPERGGILDRLIAEWRERKVTYTEFLSKLFSRIFEDINTGVFYEDPKKHYSARTGRFHRVKAEFNEKWPSLIVENSTRFLIVVSGASIIGLIGFAPHLMEKIWHFIF